MIVVDTNVWSETLRPEPNQRVLQWFRTNAVELHMSALVAHELVFGVQLLPDGSRRDRIAGHVDAMIARLTDQILPYDVDTAIVHAQLLAAARRNGREPSAQDGQIAAHAVQHDVVARRGHVNLAALLPRTGDAIAVRRAKGGALALLRRCHTTFGYAQLLQRRACGGAALWPSRQ